MTPFRLAYLSMCFLLTATEEIIVLSPPKLVGEYGASTSANCSAKVSADVNVINMDWEAPLGEVVKEMGAKETVLTWIVHNLTEWNIKPFCYITTKQNQIKSFLPVTVYKIPDNVSISSVNHTGPHVEGKEYQLQCNIQNVAPVQNVVVNWYKGQTIVEKSNITGTGESPQSTSATFVFRPSRIDNGAQYKCEAQLELGPYGPKTPPSLASEPLSMNVHYKPEFFNSTETFDQTDKNRTLNCTVRANPLPTYSWSSPTQSEEFKGAVFTVPPYDIGNYSCTAKNQYGSAEKLFIIRKKDRDYTVLWAIIGAGLTLVAVLIVGYLIMNFRNSNSVI
ncbi:intercellular adhesion molecule 1-like [Hoplias malabaricus]|uniref:intercellular adhesion molecule 1-like n=1 Tax=Hoplias malabaricus TaxID=27720 RepID=UPI0034637A9B